MDGGSLNQFLQPSNAPVANTIHPRSSFFFNEIGGRNSVTATKVKSVYAGNILAGTVEVGINIGSASTGYVKLDGANDRIVINDGTVNRIIIGSA